MNEAQNLRARDFNPFSFPRFEVPCVFMMICLGLYTMVDTVFAARFVNIATLV